MKPKARRFRWLHFTLRSLFVVITFCCVLLGISVKQARERKAAVMAIKQAGGTFGVHIEGPEWVRRLIGDEEYFYNISRVTVGPSSTEYDPDRPFDDAQLGEIIEHINRFSSFSVLSLDRSKVTDKGLAHLRRLHNLEILRLSYTEVTDAGIDSLHAIKALNQIDLVNCPITDDGVRRLEQALPECEVRR